ncbi:hypothetical protein RCL_jg7660.t1 [Rhizophagus clarus]|uniref:Uncharacterized protein n=1 Tax=Rhizophagus clarus TaxID=94130 RepID=A0A8H3R6K3_9GLOM|nr:hypothetical protein RCL_jg7660.t1 [Rhizophagus clarus]
MSKKLCDTDIGNFKNVYGIWIIAKLPIIMTTFLFRTSVQESFISALYSTSDYPWYIITRPGDFYWRYSNASTTNGNSDRKLE